MLKQKTMITFRPSILDLHIIDEIKAEVIDQKGVIFNLSEILRYSLQETIKVLRQSRVNAGEESA